MTTTHEDLIADDFTDLLAERGQSFVYCRGNSTSTVSMVKQTQRTEQVDSGNGLIVEVIAVDFKCLTSALPFAVPKQGDQLKAGGETWEICPQPGGSKVYQQITKTVTRLHAVQVK